MLESNYQWIIKKADENKVRELSESMKISEMTAKLLVLRGIEDPGDADLFLHPGKVSFHKPMSMLGMKKVSDRVKQAISDNQPIRIFGDYDADGVTSTALLFRALKKIGADVSYYIPNRFKDGYGPNAAAVEKAQEDGIGLIVTVDSGIAAFEAAEKAKSLGIDYIITDHHEPPESLPDAYAILNPKQRGCDYPFKGLSGAGVALKLVQNLCDEDQFDEDWLALAAIGTIADLVPLRNENRLIAYSGLEKISVGSLPGIDALKAKAGHPGPVDSEVIGFQMAPRLNAAGRLTDADLAIRLLLSDDAAESAGLADQLESLNQRRKKMVDQVSEEADAIAAEYIRRGDRALVLAGSGWHQGVIGIAASRIVEKYYRPVILLSIDEENGVAKGSGRSINGFNLYQGLTESARHLIQFGGHQMAAGLSLRADDIDAFRDDFIQNAARVITDEMMIHGLSVDGECQPDQVTAEQVDQLAMLAPFGTDNPRPVFQMHQVRLAKINSIGRDKAHLKVSFIGTDSELDGIGFRLGKAADRISINDLISVIGECQINEWNGFRKPQFLIEDVRVDGPQVFDWRAERELREKLNGLPTESSSVLAFHSETARRYAADNTAVLYHSGMTFGKPALILLDLPDSKEQLSELIRSSPIVNRFYVVFAHDSDHYFSAFPTRKHFIWYYALIKREHSFKLDQMAGEIARFKGWSQRTVFFMTKVFFELGFVKIEDGVLTVNPVPSKAPLTDSDTYRKEKNQLELEDFFCYSSISTLKSWFIEMKKSREQAIEPEGTINGL